MDADGNEVVPAGKARFIHLRIIANAEKNRLVKLAPKLSFKTVYPTNFDKCVMWRGECPTISFQ